MAAPVTAPTSEALVIQGLLEENKQLWKVIERQAEDYALLAKRVKALESLPHTAPQKHDRKMARVDRLFVSNNNMWMKFADIGKQLEYPKDTRRQNMTKIGNIMKQFPDRYEVKASKLGGKVARLVPAYLNHLLNGEV